MHLGQFLLLNDANNRLSNFFSNMFSNCKMKTPIIDKNGGGGSRIVKTTMVNINKSYISKQDSLHLPHEYHNCLLGYSIC